MDKSTMPSLVGSSFPDDTIANCCGRLALLAAGLASPFECQWADFPGAAIEVLGEIREALSWEAEHRRSWSSPYPPLDGEG